MILKSLDIGGRKGFPPASLDIGDHTAHYFHVSGIIELLDLTMDGAAAISALGALAQETRLAIYRLLVQCSSDGLAAGAIAERLDLPPSSLSFHLAQLAHARLIVQRREGRSLIDRKSTRLNSSHT